jgi:hypothetical protein
MAFDRPLEADRVDDLGLLSSFVRSPLVGPILWLLGNHLSSEENKENPKRSIVDKSSLEQTSKENWASNTSEDCEDNSLLLISRKLRDPSLNTLTDIPNDVQDVSTGNTTKNTKDIGHQRNWRKTSWSDESGQNLVEYFNPDVSLTTLISFQRAVEQALFKQLEVLLLSFFR